MFCFPKQKHENDKEDTNTPKSNLRTLVQDKISSSPTETVQKTSEVISRCDQKEPEKNDLNLNEEEKDALSGHDEINLTHLLKEQIGNELNDMLHRPRRITFDPADETEGIYSVLEDYLERYLTSTKIRREKSIVIFLDEVTKVSHNQVVTRILKKWIDEDLNYMIDVPKKVTFDLTNESEGIYSILEDFAERLLTLNDLKREASIKIILDEMFKELNNQDELFQLIKKWITEELNDRIDSQYFQNKFLSEIKNEDLANVLTTEMSQRLEKNEETQRESILNSEGEKIYLGFSLEERVKRVLFLKIREKNKNEKKIVEEIFKELSVKYEAELWNQQIFEDANDITATPRQKITIPISTVKPINLILDNIPNRKLPVHDIKKYKYEETHNNSILKVQKENFTTKMNDIKRNDILAEAPQYIGFESSADKSDAVVPIKDGNSNNPEKNNYKLTNVISTRFQDKNSKMFSKYIDKNTSNKNLNSSIAYHTVKNKQLSDTGEVYKKHENVLKSNSTKTKIEINAINRTYMHNEYSTSETAQMTQVPVESFKALKLEKYRMNGKKEETTSKDFLDSLNKTIDASLTPDLQINKATKKDTDEVNEAKNMDQRGNNGESEVEPTTEIPENNNEFDDEAQKNNKKIENSAIEAYKTDEKTHDNGEILHEKIENIEDFKRKEDSKNQDQDLAKEGKDLRSNDDTEETIHKASENNKNLSNAKIVEEDTKEKLEKVMGNETQEETYKQRSETKEWSENLTKENIKNDGYSEGMLKKEEASKVMEDNISTFGEIEKKSDDNKEYKGKISEELTKENDKENKSDPLKKQEKSETVNEKENDRENKFDTKNKHKKSLEENITENEEEKTKSETSNENEKSIEEKTAESDGDGENAKDEDSFNENESALQEVDDTISKEGKSPKTSSGAHDERYCLQDDVRFLKFVASLNFIECTCNRAGNDFVLEVNDNTYHYRGCPSSLAPRDIESIKILFLTKHLPVCKRFLTADERKILKNILLTAPYYQVDFFTYHHPYNIRSDNKEMIKSHMLEERAFPKREDGSIKNKKAILDDLKDILDPPPPPVDPNVNRFPREDYKFGNKYEEKLKRRALDINEYPYEHPTPSTVTRPTNKDIGEERLILDLLNDFEAWRCFTFICICDILEPLEDDYEPEHNPTEEQLKAALLSGVPANEQKEMLAMINKNLKYFDDVIKNQLRSKIERERDYMQMLKDGKLKKEKLFLEILPYQTRKSKDQANQTQTVPTIVNDMFKEMLKNNRDIVKDMEDKMRREDFLMERNIHNELNKRTSNGDLELAFPKNERFEQHIKDTMQAMIQKEYDLIRSELEFELDRSNEATLRIFQDFLNQLGKNNGADYDNIDEMFKSLYSSTDSAPNSSDISRPLTMDSSHDPSSSETAPAGQSDKSKTRKRASLSHLKSDQVFDDPTKRNVSYDITLEDIEEKENPLTQDNTSSTPSQDDGWRRPEIEDKSKDRKSEQMRSTRDFQTQTERERSKEKGLDSSTLTQRKTDSKSRTLDLIHSRAEKATSTSRSTLAENPTLFRELDAQNKQEQESDAQITPSRESENRPESLCKEMDSMMEMLWNSDDDKIRLIRELADELRRFDLTQQEPREKAMATKKSFREFKEELDSKIKPSRGSVELPSTSFEPSNRQGSKRHMQEIEPLRDYQKPQDRDTNILYLFDADFRYLILELPMDNLKLDIFHDSFYGRRKALTTIDVESDRTQIRTDIEMSG